MKHKAETIALTSSASSLIVSANDIQNILSWILLGISIISTIISLIKDFKKTGKVNVEEIIRLKKEYEEAIKNKK